MSAIRRLLYAFLGCWQAAETRVERRARVEGWRQLLGVERTVIELDEDDEGVIVVHVRPFRSATGCCGVCGRRAPGYDQGEGRRRWRVLDLGVTKAFLEAEAPRVRCPTHAVVVAAVPWARHGSRFTRWFEDVVAWLARHTSKHAVTQLLRITWRTVGSIVAPRR